MYKNSEPACPPRSESALAEPAFRQVAGALESTSCGAVNQMQARQRRSTPRRAQGLARGRSMVAGLGDLIQLLGTPFFPPTSHSWLLIFLLLEPDQTRLYK